MVRNWIVMTVEDQLVVHKGLGLAEWNCLGLFYKGNGFLGSQDPEWLQGEINVLIGLFRQYRLVVKVAKSKTMTCQTGTLRYGMLEGAVVWRCTRIRQRTASG